MAFGKRRAAVAAVAAVVMICGAMALVPFVSRTDLVHDLRSDVFRAFGAGSEIGVSVREMSNDEVAKAAVATSSSESTPSRRHWRSSFAPTSHGARPAFNGHQGVVVAG